MKIKKALIVKQGSFQFKEEVSDKLLIKQLRLILGETIDISCEQVEYTLRSDIVVMMHNAIYNTTKSISNAVTDEISFNK